MLCDSLNLVAITTDQLPLEEIHTVSKKIAFAVGKKAIEQGVALEITEEALQKAIDQHFWQPVYRRYKRTAF